MEELVSPKELMEKLKDSKKQITDEELIRFNNVCIEKLQKYLITEQLDACKKIKFLVDTVTREQKLLKFGIDTYVFFNDLAQYIDNVKDKQISVIELSRYEREIPDEIIDTISICKENKLFDEYIVVFTDYNKEMSKKTKKQDREKDPILFGMFYDKTVDVACPRFYYLGDWIDEHCDLTLEKMLSVIGEDKGYKIDKPIQSIEELNDKLSALEKNVNTRDKLVMGDRRVDVYSEQFKTNPKQKRNIFQKIKSFIKKGE